jgi:hypothetical protein
MAYRGRLELIMNMHHPFSAAMTFHLGIALAAWVFHVKMMRHEELVL